MLLDLSCVRFFVFYVFRTDLSEFARFNQSDGLTPTNEVARQTKDLVCLQLRIFLQLAYPHPSFCGLGRQRNTP